MKIIVVHIFLMLSLFLLNKGLAQNKVGFFVGLDMTALELTRDHTYQLRNESISDINSLQFGFCLEKQLFKKWQFSLYSSYTFKKAITEERNGFWIIEFPLQSIQFDLWQVSPLFSYTIRDRWTIGLGPSIRFISNTHGVYSKRYKEKLKANNRAELGLLFSTRLQLNGYGIELAYTRSLFQSNNTKSNYLQLQPIHSFHIRFLYLLKSLSK